MTWDNQDKVECREVEFAGLFDVCPKKVEEKVNLSKVDTENLSPSVITPSNNGDVRVENPSAATSIPMSKQSSGCEIARSLDKLGRGPSSKVVPCFIPLLFSQEPHTCFFLGAFRFKRA